MSITRRNFLAATAAATAATPAIHGAEKAKKYRTVLIGTGWWGMNLLRTAIEAGQSDVVAMCDVDQNQLDKAHGEIEKMTGAAPKKYKDYRDLLKEEKPDIAIVATPDHWHPLITIAACEAGAHVYVEKPVGTHRTRRSGDGECRHERRTGSFRSARIAGFHLTTCGLSSS